MKSQIQQESNFTKTSKSLPQTFQYQQPNINLIKKNTKPQQQLQELLTCQICYSIAKNIMMCPHCSKIYCQGCIKKSLNIKSQCPHCRKHVRDSKSMANCQRFVNQVKGIVEQVLKQKQKQNFRCQEHDVALNYYCIKCQRSVCCECKMFGSHKDHSLIQIQKKFQQKYQKLRSMLAELKVAIKQKQQNVNNFQSLLYQTQLLYKSQLNQINKLQHNYDEIHLKQIKHYKQLQKNNVIKLEDQVQKLSEIKRDLRSQASKTKKLGKYNLNESYKNKLLNTIESLNNRTQLIKQGYFGKKSFISDLIPTYHYQTFKIHNFSQRLKQPKLVIYSDPIQILNCQWKLKIYHNGSQSVQGKYLSVYVMMVSNKNKSNEKPKLISSYKNNQKIYEYFIQVLSQKDFPFQQNNVDSLNNQIKLQQKAFSRQYSSAFEPGQSWGYNKFIELSQLYSSGYVNMQTGNCLTIKYGIRRPDYFSEYKSLLNQLNNLEQQIIKCQMQNQQTKNINKQDDAQKNQNNRNIIEQNNKQQGLQPEAKEASQNILI